MHYRTLGRTGLSVSALSLGTAGLGMAYGIPTPEHRTRTGEKDAIRLVHAALDGGINLIDTARAYGESERILGKALLARRDQVILASKASAHEVGGAALVGDALHRQMLDQLEESLHLLRTEYVDLWQIHNVDQALLARHGELAALFEAVKEQGKVRFVGGSFYGADLPLAALSTNLFDAYQITYSVLDQRMADRFFAAAKAQKVGVVARSVLLKGALTDRADYLPDHLGPLRARSRSFRQLIAQAAPDLTSAQAAVAFAVAQSGIHSVLLGVISEDELKESLYSLEHPLSAELMNKLYALRLDDADLLNPGTWGIG